MDVEIYKGIQTTLKRARVSILEYKLCEAVTMSMENMGEAKARTNGQINPRALELAGIKPLQDVHRCLWGLVAEVLEGKPIKV